MGPSLMAGFDINGLQERLSCPVLDTRLSSCLVCVKALQLEVSLELPTYSSPSILAS